MFAIPRLAWLWPGLPWVWAHGSLKGLATALLAAASLNTLILATWMWTELPWLQTSNRTLLGWLLATFWIISIIHALWCCRPPTAETHLGEKDVYPQAMQHYLRGNWVEAQELLKALLGIDPADVEARLLLVNTLRRSGQKNAALAELEETLRYDRASKWEWELQELGSQLRAESAKTASLENSQASASAAKPLPSAPTTFLSAAEP